MNKKDRVDTSALFAGMIGRNGDEQSSGDVTTGEITDGKKLGTDGEIEKKVVAQPTPAPAIKKDAETVEDEEDAEAPKIGRKPNKEKRIQVSIYLTPAQAKELRLQDAEKEKEADKSAIARTGIDIALALSSEEYKRMKAVAVRDGKTPGEVIKAALAMYF